MCSLPTRAGHKYWICATIKKSSASSNIALVVVDGGSQAVASSETTTGIQTICGIHTCVNPNTTNTFIIEDRSASNFASFEVYEAYFVDLTQMYSGADLIPADLLAHPENFFRYYSGSLAYRTGGMLFSQARYLKTYGRNQFDGVLEGNSIGAQGQDATSGTSFRTKNYQRVNPNTTYHYHAHSLLGVQSYIVAEYDANNTFVKRSEYYANNNTFTTEPNTCYVRMAFYKSGSTWGTTPPSQEDAQIVLSLYYSGESGYNEYYAFEQLENIDTGNENLLWARNSADEKLDNGIIIRNIGTIDLHFRDWELVEESSYWYWVSASPTGSKNFGSENMGNVVSDNYETVIMNNSGLADNTIAMDGTVIVCRTADKTVPPSGMVYFELAESTTEQGTAFTDKANINDFGSMSLESSNGIPQGIEIFYPVDYKAFVDSAYNRTDGDASNIALMSDLEAEDDKVDELYAIYKTNMGGALKHQLASANSLDFNDLAYLDLTDFVWHLSSGFWDSDVLTGLENPLANNIKADILCPIYDTDTYYNVYVLNANKLSIRDTSVTTGDQLKAKCKGILLAYKKASS